MEFGGLFDYQILKKEVQEQYLTHLYARMGTQGSLMANSELQKFQKKKYIYFFSFFKIFFYDFCYLIISHQRPMRTQACL